MGLVISRSYVARFEDIKEEIKETECKGCGAVKDSNKPCNYCGGK